MLGYNVKFYWIRLYNKRTMSVFKTALKFIRYDRAKSIGVTVGIVISTFLIGQQLGILDFLTNLMVASANNASAEIWVVDASSTDMNQLGRIDSKFADRVRSIPGVKEAFPVVVSGATATYPNGSNASILLIGSEGPYYPAGPSLPKIRQGKRKDLQKNMAISSEFFDAETVGASTDVGTMLEINGKQAIVALQTKGVRGFGAPIAYTTIERARYFANISRNEINAVLVNCDPNANVEQVTGRINKTFSGVRAWPTELFKKSTVTAILTTSGIAVSTGSLIIFALISGFFIIGLTLYSSALDRLKDYGTLKAIGAKNRYVRKLILMQAFLFAVVGFSIGLVLLELFRQGVAKTGLLFSLSPLILFAMFLVIVLISTASSAFALKRIRGVEPASVFR